jgi:hypothetical protein
LFHIILLSVYKNPLSVFKIKIEVEKGDKIFVHDIHLAALLDYKSNVNIKNAKQFLINSLIPV